MSPEVSIVPVERAASVILFVRGQKVILDSDLAELYEVDTKNLNKAVSRNKDRFPPDFMFQLSVEEWQHMRDQGGAHGGRRTPPYAFTEQGVAML